MKQAITGLLVAALVVMLCTCGCSTTLSSSRAASPGQDVEGESITGIEGSLEGMTWYLVVFHTASGRSVDVLPGTDITAYLDGSGKIRGNAGCNKYSATYSVSSDLLSIGDPATTRMYCGSPTGIMTQEVTYLAVLQRVSHYKIEGSLLTMMERDGTPILTFSTVKPAIFSNNGKLHQD